MSLSCIIFYIFPNLLTIIFQFTISAVFYVSVSSETIIH